MRNAKSQFVALNAVMGALLATTGFGQNLSNGVLTTVQVIVSVTTNSTTINTPDIDVPDGQGGLRVDVGNAVGNYYEIGGSGSLIPGFGLDILAQIGTAPTPEGYSYSGYFRDESSVANSVLVVSSPPAGRYYFNLAVPPSDPGAIQIVVSTYQIRATYFPPAPVITVQPASTTIPVGGSVTFGVTATGTGLIYQWRKNSVAIGGANSATYTLYSVIATDAGNYDVIVRNSGGTVTSSVATLTVPTPPTMTVQPQNVTAINGQSVTLRVTASGTAPMTYQWQKDGSNLVNGGHISGASTATLTLASISATDTGSYNVVVANSYGRTTSSLATVTVDFQPSITSQPSDQTVTAGGSANFSVGATGTAPLTYQWQKNDSHLVSGGNVTGATTPRLTITSISDSDAASYSVIVSNAEGIVLSSNAMLKVNDSVFIAAQPLSQTIGIGSTVTFTATVYGAPPFVSQWFFNRTPVGSATGGTKVSPLTLTNVRTNQAGNYSVQVFNGYGSVMSSNAVLTVIPQPTIFLQILAGYPVLSLYGTLGSSFMVQYNTNLEGTNWMNLSLINLSANPFQLLDPSGAGQPARFYRAVFMQ